MPDQDVAFFEIPLDRFTHTELLTRLEDILEGQTQQCLATPNPEMLLAASRDDEIARVLRRMDLRIPDGVGLSLMARCTRQGRLQRFPGVDVFLDICCLAAERHMHVLLLGGWGSDAAVAGRVLEAAFPGLRVSSLGDVQIRFEDGLWEQPVDIIDCIRAIKPDVIGVALGGSQYERQERWIVDHAARIPSAKLCMGIGGGIDMISGRTKRAPAWMRAIGGEWFWRFARDPRRFSRIWNATIRFPIAVILDRIHEHTL
ncbi:MAG: WecB/TagA/CpsF family glycosyltransferase [Patescibacteria group bacterium]